MDILGLILARGGSKRVPRKNVKMLGGVPLIAWTINAAQQSILLDDLYVSSDDEEILDIADDWDSGWVQRPDELASDTATSYQAIIHALNVIEDVYDMVCLLQPTSPFRTVYDIDMCISLLLDHSELPAFASFEHDKEVPNGAVYVGFTDWLRDGGSWDGPAVGRYYMPPRRSLDIDTLEDWARAEEIVSESL